MTCAIAETVRGNGGQAHPLNCKPSKRIAVALGGLLPALLCLTLAGCRDAGPHEDRSPTEQAPAGVKLRLLVVDDPALAAAAGQLRGEWEAQTGSDFQIEQIAAKELAGADSLAADAVLCPAHLLGPLARRKQIAPVPAEMTQSGDWTTVFELLRCREAAWADDVYAVAFGSPVLICYYRADLLEKLDRRPPQTWQEYHRLAELLWQQKNSDGDSPWCGAIEPLAPGWAAIVLLARAAPYAKHHSNYSTLFDIDTMEPLVAGPPWVRALEELVAVCKFGPAEKLGYDPASARAAFWQGRCGMALTWPTAAGEIPQPVCEEVRIGFAELPGAPEVYNIGASRWDTRAEDVDPRVPLLGSAGRIGVVAVGSANRPTAFRLLAWLSGGQYGSKLCASSPATTLFRRPQLKSPQTWAEAPVPPVAAAQYAAATERTFLRQQWLFALRIPGREEYLASLDAAVRRAVRAEKPPAEALQEAAAQWEQITERLGTGQQKLAYLHSLGLK